ncbi:hypothetical protein ACP4OV_016288 [Aristida adscensionis]
MAAPADLPDDAIYEILVRLPQDDPSCLLRASVACKPWLRIASSPAFRRRLGEFHPTPPLLGFLRDHCPRGPRFTATTASAFSPPGEPSGAALDCRHGRALFLVTEFQLAVWEPVTGDLRRVPTPPTFDDVYFMPNAAVLCAASGCDHRCCAAGGPFLVVFVFSKSKGGPIIMRSETVAEVCVYSSETDAWDEPTTIHIDSLVTTKRSVLVGRKLFIEFDSGYIVEYDLCDRGFVVTRMEESLFETYRGNIMLMPMEEGLGFAGVEGLSLSLWSRKETGHGDELWEEGRVIDLGRLLPTAQDVQLLGFAECVNVILLGTNNGFFTLDLKSGQARKVCHRDESDVLLPFVSYYTPAPGMATGMISTGGRYPHTIREGLQSMNFLREPRSIRSRQEYYG